MTKFNISCCGYFYVWTFAQCRCRAAGNQTCEDRDLMMSLVTHCSASFSCFPLRFCPSWRSFTMWRTGILITSTWPSLFCSFSQRMILSTVPSTRWWVDTIWGALLTFTRVAVAPCHYSPAPEGTCLKLFGSLLTLTDPEEHHMVLWEVTDGDLPRQFAHPGGHPHHPVQHDSDEGRLACWRRQQGCFQKCNSVASACVSILSRISISTPTVWLHSPTCLPSSVVFTSMLPNASSGEDTLIKYILFIADFLIFSFLEVHISMDSYSKKVSVC